MTKQVLTTYVSSLVLISETFPCPSLTRVLEDCISNANNAANTFSTVGCAKELSRLAVGQTLGLAVINSFLVIIALATIATLLQAKSSEGIVNSQYVNEAVPPAQSNQYPFGGYNQGASYANNNPAYPM